MFTSDIPIYTPESRYLFRVVLYGDSRVGKSSILNRLKGWCYIWITHGAQAYIVQYQLKKPHIPALQQNLL